MTPRVDVTALEDTATMEEAANLLRETGYTRVPVYHEDMDHIVGILNEKDFYACQHEGVDSIVDIMKPPVYAPATLKLSKLLKLFQTQKTHMLIVLDEFGGTEGIVTMEDVLEELVGEIYDEHDDVSEESVEMADGSRVVEGGMELTELLEGMGLKDTFNAETVGITTTQFLLGNGDSLTSRFVEPYHSFSCVFFYPFSLVITGSEKILCRCDTFLSSFFAPICRFLIITPYPLFEKIALTETILRLSIAFLSSLRKILDSRFIFFCPESLFSQSRKRGYILRI